MIDGLFIVSLVGSFVQAIKEAVTPVIPAENWENKELYYNDMRSGMSFNELMRNVERGRYRIEETKEEAKKCAEPHRNKDGKIVIENCLMYKEDVKKYGAYQAHQWVMQGKYNLAPEELQKEEERIRRSMNLL